MLKSTDDLRITEIKPLPTPIEVMRTHPRTDAATRTVIAARHDLHNILVGQDDRLAVIVGPCSADNEDAVCDYISGMTDQYSMTKFRELFIPNSWSKL